MQSRAPVSLFPFLSVLLCTMGILSFLAVTFLLFSNQQPQPPAEQQDVDVRWSGAPPHVRPVLVEVRAGGIVYRGRPDEAQRRFSRRTLQREAEALREVADRAWRRLGFGASRYERWLYVMQAVQDDRRFRDSFTRLMHRMEMDNLFGRARERRVEYYPILLVYSDGVATYDLASYLVETATRLNIGLEPMLEGWQVPYTEHSS